LFIENDRRLDTKGSASFEASGQARQECAMSSSGRLFELAAALFGAPPTGQQAAASGRHGNLIELPIVGLKA